MKNNYIYYIQLKGQKKGPLNIDELKKVKISPDDLVWRNDSPDWITAKNFEELKENLVIIPPLLPNEKRKIEAKNLFEKQIQILFKYYIIASVILGIITSIIAIISYDNWPGKGKESEFGSSTYVKYRERYLSPKIGWDYTRNNESVYADNQNFILRPMYALFSTVYLTKEEQESYFIVFVKQFFSSFFFLALVFSVILGIKYYQSQQVND